MVMALPCIVDKLTVMVFLLSVWLVQMIRLLSIGNLVIYRSIGSMVLITTLSGSTFAQMDHRNIKIRAM